MSLDVSCLVFNSLLTEADDSVLRGTQQDADARITIASVFCATN